MLATALQLAVFEDAWNQRINAEALFDSNDQTCSDNTSEVQEHGQYVLHLQPPEELDSVVFIITYDVMVLCSKLKVSQITSN